MQLQQDSAALWILITVEVLELENVAEPESLTLPGTMDEPIPLEKMHSLIMAHDDSQFVCTYLAWTFVLSRAAKNPKEAPLLESISKSQSSKNKEPIYMQMLHACLRPEAGLFRFILSLLTNSPLFVTSVAWKTASWISDPNVIAYRSLLKGAF